MICREAKSIRISWLAWFMLVVPAMIALLGDWWGDLGVEIIIPTLFTGFLIFNDMLMSMGLWAMLALYVAFVHPEQWPKVSRN